MAKVTTALFGDIALLPFQIRQPMRHTLAWVTDLFESQNGTEGAIQLRQTPKESYSVTIPEKADTKQRGFNTQYGALHRRWGMPVWQEQQYIGNVAAGFSTLDCETENYDFRPGSLALLISAVNPADNFQVLEVSTVNDGVLLLSNVTTEISRAYLLPLRVGRITSQASRKANGTDVVTDLTFESDEEYLLTPEAPEQFLDEDIYFTPPIMDGGTINFDVITRVDTVDYDIGPVTTRAPWLHNRVGRPQNVVCSTLEEVIAFKLWLFRRAGKYRRYWEPSFEHDFRVMATGAVNSTLLVGREGMTDWGTSRTHIAIELDDGTWSANTVTFTNVTPITSQINLGTSLGGIDASRLRRISWLGLRRLNADMIEMNWVGSGVMKAGVATIEVAP